MTIDRVLIVGLGSIGRRHARIARALLPDAEMTVLRRSEGGDLAGTGIDRCVTSLTEAIAAAPQVAVIASPASHHLESALPLAHAGVHLLVEKPIASRAEGVADLLAVVRAGGLTLMTGYNLRFLPSLRRFRELVREGRVGRVLSVRCEIGQYLPHWRPGTDYRTSVSARADLGGGVLPELSHEIDYLRWLFGEVCAVTAVVRRQSDLDIDVPDSAILALELGAPSGGRPVVASLNMDFVRHDTTRQCVVIGDQGTLRWDALTGTVELFAAGATAWSTLATLPAERDHTYREEWRHFLACIDAGEPPLVGGADGLAVLRIIEAAHASSETGRRMQVPLPGCAGSAGER